MLVERLVDTNAYTHSAIQILLIPFLGLAQRDKYVYQSNKNDVWLNWNGSPILVFAADFQKCPQLCEQGLFSHHTEFNLTLREILFRLRNTFYPFFPHLIIYQYNYVYCVRNNSLNRNKSTILKKLVSGRMKIIKNTK